MPDPQVNSRALDCWSKFCQDRRCQRQTLFELQSIDRLFGWQKGQRDFREATFFGTKARPESSIDDRFNRSRIRRVSEFPLITLAGFRQMARKVGLNYRGHRSSGLVGWFAEHRNSRHRLPPKAAQKDP